jgi:hypothetical protein
VPAADTKPAAWRYTTSPPQPGWISTDFDDSSWKKGKSGFGTPGTPGAIVGTPWRTPDIWLRRQVELPRRSYDTVQLWIHHDEDADIYINGVLAARCSGYRTGYEQVPLRSAARAALRPDKNLVAAHCRQTTGGQYIDVGLVDVIESK